MGRSEGRALPAAAGSGGRAAATGDAASDAHVDMGVAGGTSASSARASGVCETLPSSPTPEPTELSAGEPPPGSPLSQRRPYGKNRAEIRHLLKETGILDSLFRFRGTRWGSTVVHRSPSLTVSCCPPPPISLDKERGSTRAGKKGSPEDSRVTPRPAPATVAHP